MALSHGVRFAAIWNAAAVGYRYSSGPLHIFVVLRDLIFAVISYLERGPWEISDQIGQAGGRRFDVSVAPFPY